MKKRADWVVCKKEDGAGVFHCLRCGDRYDFRGAIPCALDVYIGAVQGYIKAHAHCRAKKR
jgi:hypothetical protein